MSLDHVLTPAPPSPGSTAPRRSVLELGVTAGLVVLLFAGRFVQLVGVWWQDPSYSHGFLVPFISGWLAWRQLRAHPAPPQGEVGPAVAALVSGCLLHLVALVLGAPLIDFCALALVLRGVAVGVGGRAWAGRFTFPILFLFFLFPLPGLLTATAALWLQNQVSACSAAVLDLFVLCVRRGHTLYLAGLAEPLVVAAECSGLRQIVAFLALAALVGHLGRLTWVSWLVLTVAVLPVAVFANVVRVLLLASAALHFGSGWLTGSLHSAPAALTLPLGLALFAGIARVLPRRRPEAVP